MTNNLPLIVIFGRTNVGKSTLFNCLIEKRKALVSDIPGTTRDSNLGTASWRGFNFSLIDTGGIMDLKWLSGAKNKASDIDAKVQAQSVGYLRQADIILFLVDAQVGLMPQDKDMALMLKKLSKAKNLQIEDKLILVANKSDSPKIRRETPEFNKLSLGEPLPISATTGSGTGDLLDLIVEKLKPLNVKQPAMTSESKNFKKKMINSQPDEPISDSASPIHVRVCIIGKPNVGKSSLINKIIGEDRVIVSPVPHTTREPQDIEIMRSGYKITLVDTAGLSRQGQKGARRPKIKNSLEKLSISKSLKALDDADIALLIIDIYEGITHQEAKLIEEIVKRKKSLIIVANKWDLVANRDTKVFTAKIYAELPFATWAPVQFISALTGEKVNKILDLIIQIDEQRKTLISDNALTKLIGKLVKIHRPAKGKGFKHPHIYEFKQERTNPPLFSLRIGGRDSIHFSYLRFIENRLREKFGFIGTPISIYVDKNRRVHGKAEN
jgi:GTP-binding protein